MAKILITGSNGQVGRSFANIIANYPEHKFHLVSRKELDISKKKDVNEFLKQGKYDWIINCAAYTKVDLAESEAELCYRINEDGPLYLAQAATLTDTTLVHISSDYVYHSNFGQPFLETSITNPQSIYAKSKLAGEIAIQSSCPKHFLLRTSWVYAEHGNNFVRTMLRLGMERDNLSVVCDQIGAPTYAHDLAKTILQIIASTNQNYGVYNFANTGQTSWYNFTRSIHDILGIECLVTPIRTDEYPTAAARPPYSVMNLEKIQSTFNIEIRDWEDALKQCLNAVISHV